MKTSYDKNILEWHGAPEQIRRVVEGIIAQLDEDFYKASISFNIDALISYISSVRVLYNNVEVLIPYKEKKVILSRIYRLDFLKYELMRKKEISFREYISLLEVANLLERKLRNILQRYRLLYLVRRAIKYDPILEEVLKNIDDREEIDIIKLIPSIKSVLDDFRKEEKGQETSEEEEDTQKIDYILSDLISGSNNQIEDKEEDET